MPSAIPGPPPLATATLSGLVSTSTQTFAGIKTFQNSIINQDVLGLAQIATGSLPAAASYEAYIVYDSTTNQVKFSDGTAWFALASAGGSSYSTIQEEGSSLTQRTTLNFIGAGITAVDNGGSSRTDVTLHQAGASQEGVVSTGTQTFGGAKTFNTSVAITGTTGNTLVVDATTLVVDASNNRVGFGTASPTQPVDILGNVLITRPDLGAVIALKNTFSTGGSVLDTYNDSNTIVGSFGTLNTGSTESNPGHAFIYTNTTFDLQFRYGNPGASSVVHVFKSTGSVGLGTNSPTSTSRLTVSGKSDFTDIVGLPKIATGSLPAASSFEGYVVYDDTTNEFKYSNGSAWVSSSGGMSIGGTVTSGTAGSILFVGSGSVLAQDNANIFWDDTNDRLGIRTNSPSTQLHIIGSATNSLAQYNFTTGTGGMYDTVAGANSAFVSIGSNLVSNAWTARAVDAGIFGYSASAWRWYSNASLTNGNTYTPTERMTLAASTGNLTVDTDTLVVDAVNNRVGVVTASPSEALHVTGNVRFSGALMPNNTAGTTGQVLTSAGAGAAPTWTTASGAMSIGGTVTSGTTGSILFVGSGPVLAQDNAKLFWDDTNDFLGLGTATPNSPIQISPITVTTQATGYTSGINIGGSYTKNDANTRTFQVLNISPTLNFGGSNASTTLDILKVDNTFTSGTGATINLAKFATAGTTRAIIDVSGHLSINAGGAVAPTAPLDVTRNVGSAGIIGKFTSSTSGNTNAVEITANSITTEWGTASTGSMAFFGTKSGSNNPIYFRVNGTEVSRLNTSGFFGVMAGGADPFRRLTIQGSEEFLATFRSTGTKAKHSIDTTGGTFNSFLELGVDTVISANTGGFGSYIFTGTDSGHGVTGVGDGTTARDYYLKVDGDAVVKIATDRRMKLANAMALGSLSTTNKNALASVDNGSVVYDSTTNRVNFYENGAWVDTLLTSTNQTASGLKTLSGNTISTAADGTISGLAITSSFTKNDSNTRTFPVEQIKPTFNFGGSNANTTVNILDIDSTNTATTGLTANLVKASFGGTNVTTITSAGRHDQSGTDSSGTPGAATINKPIGISAIDTGQTSVTITNSLVTTGSWIVISPMNNTDFRMYKVAPGSGSFVVTVDSTTTATWAFSWEVKTIL